MENKDKMKVGFSNTKELKEHLLKYYQVRNGCLQKKKFVNGLNVISKV